MHSQRLVIKNHVQKQYRSILPNPNNYNIEIRNGATALRSVKRTYKCCECSEIFNSFRQLKGHEEFHIPTDESISICKYCFSLYANIETLDKHQFELHADKKYVCSPCGKRYSSKGHLLNHVISGVHNASALLYYCSLCPHSPRAAAFISRLQLQQHFEQFHLLASSREEDDNIEIEFLDEFLLSSTNENSFHFSECWDALDLHLPDMLHLASGCVNSQNIAAHDKDSEARFKCPKCYESCTNQKGLLIHLASKHKLKMLICNKCESSFCDMKLWERHKKTHILKEDLITNKKFLDCERKFKNNAEVICHEEKQSSTPQFILHECPYCSKRFHAATNMKQHLRNIHSQLKENVCQLCDKQFATLDHLKKHVLSQHHNERKHICHVCAKRFTQLCHLKQHLAIHTTGKILQCSFCESSFWKKIDLRRHILKKHEQ